MHQWPLAPGAEVRQSLFWLTGQSPGCSPSSPASQAGQAPGWIYPPQAPAAGRPIGIWGQAVSAGPRSGLILGLLRVRLLLGRRRDSGPGVAPAAHPDSRCPQSSVSSCSRTRQDITCTHSPAMTAPEGTSRKRVPGDEPPRPVPAAHSGP